MARAKVVTDHTGRFYGIRINCPGCASTSQGRMGCHVLPVRWLPAGMAEAHQVAERPHWDFDGNLDQPTLSPSILTTWNEWQGEGNPDKAHVCHSFVRAGRIEFLSDCTHALAGQTVDLPEIQ